MISGLLLVLCAGSLQAAPYNAKTEPLTEPQAQLLLQNKYQIREDGAVLAPADFQPVARADMPFVIQRLEGGQRLKALLQINIILNRSEGEKKLTLEERESIRKIVKDNWAVFNRKTRKNFRSYFTLQELELMDLVPLPKEVLAEPELKDQEAPIVPTEEAPLPAPAPAAPAVSEIPQAPAGRTSLPPAPAAAPKPAVAAPVVVAAPTSGSAPAVIVPAAPVPAAPAAAAPATAPAAAPKPAVAAPAAAPQPATAPAPAPAPAPPAPAVVAPVPAVVAATAAAVPPPAPPPAAFVPGSGAELPLGEVTAAAFEKFLEEAPYGREVKALLRLISERASFARNRVLNDVMADLPRIVIDPDQAGDRTYSRLIVGADGSPAIALNDGVVLVEKSRLFFGKTTAVLPRSAKVYSEAGLSVPALQALQAEAAPQRQESGPWGEASVYADGSRRASFTPEAQAGALLAELIRLDSRLRAWDASPYAVEFAARTAQWLFYDALASARGNDAFLDPPRRAAYRQWLAQPAAYHDMLILELSAGRNGTVDPRKVDLAAISEFDRGALRDCVPAAAAEAAYRDASARQARAADLDAYEASGLFSAESLAAARAAAAAAPAEPAPKSLCRPEWASEMAALPKSGAMLAEAVEAEKHLRQERESHVDKE
ncbi:MAG: hypothetical protein PHU21_10895 [Elusimicrobia bacterium]|nr:hypothetical protein [Elusimicrobiota bacterium]